MDSLLDELNELLESIIQNFYTEDYSEVIKGFCIFVNAMTLIFISIYAIFDISEENWINQIMLVIGSPFQLTNHWAIFFSGMGLSFILEFLFSSMYVKLGYIDVSTGNGLNTYTNHIQMSFFAGVFGVAQFIIVHAIMLFCFLIASAFVSLMGGITSSWSPISTDNLESFAKKVAEGDKKADNQKSEE